MTALTPAPHMDFYSHPVTPATLSTPLVELCSQIAGVGVSPIYLDFIPESGAPTKECFAIVENRVRAEGGVVVVGWALWEMPGVFIEAEFHAVWQRPDGQLVDVAPKKEPTRRILFLPDPDRKYQGYLVNNVRKALRQDPIVQGFLDACDEEFGLMNRGERAGQRGEVVLQGSEANEYHRIQRRKAEFSVHLVKLYPKIWPYGPCWCGSGAKTKWCHGRSTK